MKTALIADDDPANLNLLRDILAADGYRAFLAVDGPQALQIAQAECPDLILLDILMPGMDGFEVCRRLKDHPLTLDIPVIFISALNDGESITRGFEVGAADYICVPFRVLEVLARVRHQTRLLEQRRQIERQHELVNALRRQFVRSATHDLKNPLYVIQSYAQLLEEDESVARSGEARYYVQRILSSAQRMRNLVTDMLDLARIEDGTALSIQEASVNQMLTRAIHEFDLDAANRGVVLLSELLVEDRIVQVDVDAMLRVLENLLSNALKYTPAHKQILLRAWVEDSWLHVSVSDKGVGIEPQELERIFEPFYRANQREIHEVEGSGLGLSIVKQIVEQHGGRVSVESAVGRGTTFTLHLPLRAEE
ncbi:MAG: hybrid sensor histidine kinase/response regulator [Anaerolineae bacterium]|nr:hybrid sensor histidine kinase/response regulator [Anaerolineae bacterium]MDW8173960.1 hybrid sensor histidine kinase/response regulator [Anaerolineae bacterium]